MVIIEVEMKIHVTDYHVIYINNKTRQTFEMDMSGHKEFVKRKEVLFSGNYDIESWFWNYFSKRFYKRYL